MGGYLPSTNEEFYCAWFRTLKTLPGRGCPASVSLEEVIRNVKLRLPCQILGQHQSGPPAQTLSCWGRSLSHSVGCLTAQKATQCLRLLA